MNDKVNLDVLLKNIDDVSQNGKINIYAVKNHLTRIAEIYAVILPENINEEILSDFCCKLKIFQHAKCIHFDPTSSEKGAYECLSLEKIREKWNNIVQKLNDCKDFKSTENKELAKKLNLSVTYLDYQNSNFYLCAKQQNSEKLFEGKKAFLSSNDKLKSVKTDDLLVINPNVDFIIVDDKSFSWVFIFNKDKFESVFQYDEFLKESVVKKIDIVNDWTFLNSTDLIKSCINQKNVYRNLSKIFDDEQYLAKMKTTAPKSLKKRLLEKSGASFAKEDFDGDRLIVTKTNLEKVMKMLSKGFKYNFFEDRAEE